MDPPKGLLSVLEETMLLYETTVVAWCEQEENLERRHAVVRLHLFRRNAGHLTWIRGQVRLVCSMDCAKLGLTSQYKRLVY